MRFAIRLLRPALVLLAVLVVVVDARAQTEPAASFDSGGSTDRADRLLQRARAALEAQATLGNSAQTAESSQAPEERACDGCPPRRPGVAMLQATYINVFYGLANLIRGQVTARITPDTWWANMKQGFVWDLDDFLVNQFGHPYQGNNYFNAGRANGLSYWESAGVAAFGSATWEYFGETNKASLNDLINTTLGGVALGEMFHRTAWLMRDTHATGKTRLMSELGATVVDPVTGANRFITGDASRVSDKPKEFVPTQLSSMLSVGALWLGNNSGAFESTPKPFADLDLRYGDLAAGRSRTPFDAFAVQMRLGGGAPFSEVKVRGRLLGQPGRREHVQFNVLQMYDFNKNDAYQFGAQSFAGAIAYTGQVSPRLSFRASTWGGLTALGAVDSIPLTGKVPEDSSPSDAGQGVSEGPRYYDFGPGGNFGGGAVLSRNGRNVLDFSYEAHHIFSVDGIRANHFLQQLRLDLMAHIKGPLGAGISGEYFDRRTFYSDSNETRKYHFPQARIYLTWRAS